jgi:hypothetical protein
MALVKAGADVHCKDSAGCGSTGCILGSLGCHTCGLDGPSSRGSAAGACVRLCSSTALHDASYNGRTATAMALVKAGADVHCEANGGYGSTGCILVSLVCQSAGWTVLPVGRRCTLVWLAVQEDGAARCV